MLAALVAVLAWCASAPAAGARVTRFPTRYSAESLALGVDGSTWFTEPGGLIGHISPDGRLKEFSTGPEPDQPWPKAIALGPDGNMWFTWFTFGAGSDGVGRITPQGAITEFTVAPPPAGDVTETATGAESTGIAAGPDGDMWFTLAHQSRVGKVTPSGAVTVYTAGISPLSEAEGITAGPDGNMWFTEAAGRRVGRITPEGTVTEFPVSSPHNGPLDDILTGADGNLWFTETIGGSIGRITTAGVVTQFPVGRNSVTRGLASGPEGDLWVADSYQDRIVRLNTSGVMTGEFPFGDSAYSETGDVAVTSKGDVWFTLPNRRRIGWMRRPAATPQPSEPHLHAFVDPPLPGPVWIEIVCDGLPTQRCRGEETLETFERIDGTGRVSLSASPRPGYARLNLGGAAFRLAGGIGRTIRIHLNPRGLALRLRFARLPVRARLTSVGPGGTSRTVSNKPFALTRGKRSGSAPTLPG